MTAPAYRLVDVRPANAPRLRVLICHPLCDAYARILARRLPVEDRTGAGLSREPLDTVDALLTWKPPRDVMTRLTNLRWIQSTSAGIDDLLEFCRQHPDVVVTTTKGLQAENVSNLVAAMMLSLFWGLPRMLDRQRAAVWEKHPIGRLSQQTCAILGLGHVGRRVAAHARHFGMRVLGLRRQPEPSADVDRVVSWDGLPGALGESDYVVLALPRTERTRGTFGRTAFQAMKRSGYLINVARGGVVDEDALLAALTGGEIAGAAMDVFAGEPLPPEHPLWRAPNLIVTPHIGGDRADYVEQAAAIFADNAVAYPDRTRMRGIASPPDGY